MQTFQGCSTTQVDKYISNLTTDTSISKIQKKLTNHLVLSNEIIFLEILSLFQNK